MKNVFKFLTLGMMLATVIGVSATSLFAQDIDCDATYEGFKAKYKGSIDDRKAALELAKQYLAADKCKTPPENAEIVTFLTGQLTKLPIAIAQLEDAALYKRFNDSVPAKNWDETFASGKQIIAKYPDKSLDIGIVLASIGFDQAADTKAPVDKFNGDTIAQAKWVIQQIESGKTSTKYGAFGQYEYTTKDYPDGKNNTLGWMNYTIGYITYNRMKNQKEALPYLYKAAQANSATKNFSDIYKSIGEWYVSEFNRIGIERKTKIDANNGADNQETLDLWGLQKGYLDRAIDAYSRAYKVAPAEPKVYKDGLLNRAKTLYNARFDEEKDKLPLADKYIAEAPAKPFPDPATAVTPVAAPAVPSTTGTTPPATSTTTPVNTTGKTTTTTPVKKPNPKQ